MEDFIFTTKCRSNKV